MSSNINKLNQVVYQFLKDNTPTYSTITRSDIIRNIVKNIVRSAKAKSEDLTQLEPISALGASITWDETDTDKFHLSYGNLRISEDSDTEDDKITYVFPDWPEATVEKLLPDDKEHSRSFGQSVDADGDYIAVGQPGATVGTQKGKVYVYYKPTWERAELTPSFNANSALYGYLVKIKGDYCVVTLRLKTGVNARFFIFKRAGINTWTEEFVYNPGYRNFDTVSIDGDYVFVSQNTYASNSKILIFHRDLINGWELDSEITQPYLANLGTSYYCNLAQSGNYLAANFRNEDIGSYTNAGAIYIYEKTGPNTWGNEYRIQSPNPRSNDNASWWGSSISMSGDYLGVKDYGNNFYIFKRTSGNVWDDVFSFSMSDSFYQYGSIYIKGDACLIMSQSVYQGDDYAAGEVTIFERSDVNTWTEIRKIWSPVPVSQSYFGYSAAIGNNFIIAGNRRDMDIGDIYHGSAWVFSY